MGIYSIAGYRQIFPTALLLMILGYHGSEISSAQVIGEHAEMERLRVKTDEAISTGDADGASMSSGKAALMAAHLARREGDNPTGDWYRGAEAFFRSQEHAYRALALFQRAGGQPPASTGVCQSMRLASQEGLRAAEWFGKRGRSQPDGKGNSADPPLSSVTAEWQRTILEMRDEFQCPNLPNHPPG